MCIGVDISLFNPKLYTTLLLYGDLVINNYYHAIRRYLLYVGVAQGMHAFPRLLITSLHKISLEVDMLVWFIY